MIQRTVSYKNIMLYSGSVRIVDIEKKSDINFNKNEDIKEVNAKVNNVFAKIKNYEFIFKDFDSYKDFIESNLKIISICLFLDTEKLEKIISVFDKLINDEECAKDLILMEKIINRLEADFNLVNVIASKNEMFNSEYLRVQGTNTYDEAKQALVGARTTLENAKQLVSKYTFKEISNNKPKPENNILQVDDFPKDNDNILDFKGKDSLSPDNSSAPPSPRKPIEFDSYTCIDDVLKK